MLTHTKYMTKMKSTYTSTSASPNRSLPSRITGFLLAFLFVSGCTSVNYIGDEFSPTETIDIFYSEQAIEQEYDLIGHGLGSGFWVKNRKIESKLIEEAKEKGADAILITGLGKSNVLIGNGISTDEKQVNVVFLKYKPDVSENQARLTPRQ